MSLSQRLHSQLEKKMEGQFNDVEQLQNVIRQLKLLSKSQTTLLKVRTFFPSICHTLYLCFLMSGLFE